MKWRKLNRILHRDLGYIFFGMTIIYSISGVVLNHRRHGGDASIVSRAESFSYRPVEKEEVDKNFIIKMLDGLEIPASRYKNYYFQSSSQLMIYLEEGHINFNLDDGSGNVVEIRKRPVLYAFNFLHYNKPKKLWTWFSDIYAVSLGIIAITGLFILRGWHGITRRGGILTVIGLVIPAVFLFVYLWLV